MFEESGSSVALRFEVSLLPLRRAFVSSADGFGSGLGTSLGAARYVRPPFGSSALNGRLTTPTLP